MAAAFPDSPYRLQLTIVDRPVINACALPGGRIVLLRSLLEAAETPEQLAGVLAHEVQHIYQQHSTRVLLEQGSTSLLIMAVTGDFTGALAYGIEGARVL
ncbi:MAG: M48 family metalloprotease, partial [Nitrospira sp.]|nr:M48 family metalloprotease [Nitrospira sp.]